MRSRGRVEVVRVDLPARERFVRTPRLRFDPRRRLGGLGLERAVRVFDRDAVQRLGDRALSRLGVQSLHFGKLHLGSFADRLAGLLGGRLVRQGEHALLSSIAFAGNE